MFFMCSVDVMILFWQQIQELEATLYNALQQDKVIASYICWNLFHLRKEKCHNNTKYHLFEFFFFKLGNAFFPSGDKIWWTSGWDAEGWAPLIGGEAEEADVEEESRVWLPDPPGEDGTASPGPPGNTCKMCPRLSRPLQKNYLKKPNFANLSSFTENSWPWGQDRDPEKAD